ncbi:MAG: PQQ-binding-like beta-propeller repeat protein [Acidobacteriota bacterium]|nr:PQQ-binding-like beta-propeller repeat protein [Acidobacteriota bacterium]
MNSIRCSLGLIVTALLLLTVGCGQEEASWARFHGSDGQGIAEVEGLPVTWNAEGQGVRWRTEVPGRGNSSPVVHSGRIFLTTAVEAEEPTPQGRRRFHRIVLAYDLASGEKLWQTQLFTAPEEPKHRMNTFAAPTPVTDGERVYAFFGEVLAALDLDGQVMWQQQVDPRFIAESHYGAASSPVLTEDSVILFQDREVVADDQQGWLGAFSKDNGEELWRIHWDNSCCAYTTPLVVDRGAGEELYVAHSGSIAAYSAATGEEFWREAVPINQLVSSPVLEGDMLGISGGAHGVRHTRFFQLAGSGAETTREMLWEDPRQAPHTASPVLYNGLFFAVTDKGVVTCWDAQTGEVYWQERLEQWHNRVSLVAGDGKVYVPSTWGRTSVLAASQEFQLLGQNDLDGTKCNASPAIADGCLLLRTGGHLWCIDGTSTSDFPSPADQEEAPQEEADQGAADESASGEGDASDEDA